MSNPDSEPASDLPEITIYTSGAANPTTRIGGYGVVIHFAGHRNERSGDAVDTTCNRMELTAAIVALRALPGRFRVTLHSDSRYLVDAFEEGWLDDWVKSGFRGGKVKNRDLWEELRTLASKHEVRFVWVRARSGVVENVRCDDLAYAAMHKATVRIEAERLRRGEPDAPVLTTAQQGAV